MLFIANAFSVNMISQLPSTVKFSEINLQEAKEMIKNGFVSIIGHESTASVVSTLLETTVPANRVAAKLQVGDQVLVFQLQGRLPEGATLTEAEVRALPHKWVLVQIC